MMNVLRLLALVVLCSSSRADSSGWDLQEVLGGGKTVTEVSESGGDVKNKRAPPTAPSLVAGGKCPRGGDMSDALASISCSVETGEWVISKQSLSYKNAGCLIGSHWDGRDRCKEPISPPKETAVPKSPAPRDSLSKDYKRLAEKAEELVPKTWWRDGYANDLLLLSHNDKEGPSRQFSINVKLRNKKLRNLNQCVTRQQFIRKDFSFKDITTPAGVGEGGEADAKFDRAVRQRRRLAGGKNRRPGSCTAFQEPVVRSFLTLWSADRGMVGGGWRKRGDAAGKVEEGSNEASSASGGERRDPNAWEWVPREHNEGELRVAAMEVLEHFFMNYGGIWTGCFRLQDNSDCRGALAAAALTSATHIAYDVGARSRGDGKEDVGRQVVEGYLLAGLGRGLLHGDSDSTGDIATTAFKLRLADFTALQQAFLKLYTDSFGALYSAQLDTSLPLSFPPGLAVTAKKRWQGVMADGGALEPLYSHVRNWMYTEANNLIDFGPYRPLVALHSVQQELLADSDGGAGKGEGEGKGKGRRVLIDVGANGFFASPKYLIDSYAPYAPFTDVIMIEPEPHFKAGIPEAYSQRYNLTNLPMYAEVNTGSQADVITMLQSLVRPEDFVVLKFDVDPNRYAYGATMEWGFLFDLMKEGHEHIASLVDELYVELHFHYPKLFWEHYHSNWEALDMFRHLRRQGLAVHAWP